MNKLLTLVFASSVAFGASVSGTIDGAGTPLGGMEVRLWGQTAKGYSIAMGVGFVTTTDGAGAYTFAAVPAGTYKLDTRMPNGFSGNWGDRWYDVAPPSSSGYVQQDADALVLAAADALTGIDVSVELNGGIDGFVTGPSNQPLANFFVRAEAMSDRRVHHNDLSKSLAVRAGEYSMRGLRPLETRLVAHDPNYNLEDVLRPGLTITSNTVAAGPTLQLTTVPVDAREPNDDATALNAAIDGGAFRAQPPQLFLATGSIGPRSSGDSDWFCWDAVATDRYLIDVGGTLTLEDGGVELSPWVDPVLSFWEVDGGSKLFEDDDTGPGLSAHIDTGELTRDGTYCAAISTFGDTAFTGANQGSAGPYALRIELGNRRPTLTAAYQSAPAPVPPASITINEGEFVTLDLAFADPDNNLSGGTFTLTDASNGLVTGGTMNTTSSPFGFTWTASPTAARHGPYTFTATVTDGEFTTTVTVIIVVTGVNLAPGVPTLLTPDSGVSLATRSPTLVCAESYDLDEETLTYEFELSWADGGTRTGMVVGVDGGWLADAGTTAPEVFFATAPLPENSTVSWRVRAFDGVLANGHSPWTAPWTFFVDSINDPPEAPVLTKPADQEVLMVRRATLESTNPADPENEAVTLQFEVASDIAFTTVVVTSPQVPTTTGATHTMYTVPMDLMWGGSYFARVTATDSRGGVSPRSNVNAFSIRANASPPPPTLGAPFVSCGSGFTVATAPTQVLVPNVVDVEMDAITLEVQLFLASANPTTATPLFAQTVSQVGTTDTTVALSGVSWTEDETYRLRVRASDGLNTTSWSECLFTLDAVPTGTGGGMGGGAGGGMGGGAGTGGGVATGGGAATGGGTSGTGGGDGTGQKPGCNCSMVDPLAPFGLLLALGLRRRRVR